MKKYRYKDLPQNWWKLPQDEVLLNYETMALLTGNTELYCIDFIPKKLLNKLKELNLVKERTVTYNYKNTIDVVLYLSKEVGECIERWHRW